MPRRNDNDSSKGRQSGEKKKSGNNNKGPRNKRSIKSSVVNFLKENRTDPFNYMQLAAKMGIRTEEEKNLLLKALEELLVDGEIEEIKRGKYQPVTSTQYYEGKVDMTKSGSAYVTVEGMEDDIYVPPSRVNQALHGDKVRVLLYARRNNKRPEGEITEVLERKRMEFVGTLKVHEKF
nr:hypothetical protein [Bacteroidota bacterium]